MGKMIGFNAKKRNNRKNLSSRKFDGSDDDVTPVKQPVLSSKKVKKQNRFAQYDQDEEEQSSDGDFDQAAYQRKKAQRASKLKKHQKKARGITTSITTDESSQTKHP